MEITEMAINQAQRSKKKSGSLPLIMFLSMDEGDAVRPDCPHASNPFHKCADHCPQSRSRSAADGGKKGIMKMVEQRNPKTDCVHASNPFHVCTESCSQRGRPKEGAGVVNRKEAKDDGVTQQERMVNPQCAHASNPFHVCVQQCLERIAGKDGIRRISDQDQAQRAAVAVKESKDGVQVAERMVHPNCAHASNPFHVCVAACFQAIPAKDKNTYFNPLGSRVPIAKKANVGIDAKCKYASNPFHNCDEYCYENDPGKYRAKIHEKERRKRAAKMEEEKTVQSKLEATSEDGKTAEDSVLKTPENLSRKDKSEDNHEALEITNMKTQPEGVGSNELHHIYADNSMQRKPVKDIAKERLRPSSPVVFSELIFVLLYIIHLIVIAIAHSKKK